jgi:hypothetical protein
VVSGIATISSVGFYAITWNQECFHMNKIGNSTREVESDFDLVDYDDWNFMNSIFRLS